MIYCFSFDFSAHLQNFLIAPRSKKMKTGNWKLYFEYDKKRKNTGKFCLKFAEFHLK